MKYKLINITTKQETLCDKVTIDGFDYYVSDETIKEGDYVIEDIGGVVYGPIDRESIVENPKPIIATTDPNIDISKVVNEVENLAENHWRNQYIMALDESTKPYIIEDFKSGYNKSQQTHSFSAEDMIEFKEWCMKIALGSGLETKSTKELLQIWKEQQPKKVYYE